MTTTRHLIVNADDFGLSYGVNRGIIEAHEKGIVTSASLMVRQAAAAEAVAWSRNHSTLSLGLHLDLCEWAFVEDEWRALYEVAPLDNPAAVETEIKHQLATFRELAGCEPTHLDSHQHVHRTEPVRSIVVSLARTLGIPVRGETPAIRYCGDFYGQSDKGHPFHEGITVDAILKLLEHLPDGMTEMGCHPAAEPDVDSVYCAERLIEYHSLCDPGIRDVLARENIALRSFRDAKAIISGKA